MSFGDYGSGGGNRGGGGGGYERMGNGGGGGGGRYQSGKTQEHTPFPREYDFYKKRNHTMHGRRLWLNHTIWMAKITSAAKSDVHPHVVYSWRRKMGTGLA